MRQLLHWTPRILAVVFALFLALFAMDVFGEFESITETLIALFMHLIPTFLLLAATAIAWRWRIAGGAIFIALGVVSIGYFNTYRSPISFLLISMPAIIVGVLFIWDGWRARTQNMGKAGV